MTMPKLPDNLFDESTAALKGLLRYKDMYKYQMRAIQYEINRRTKANAILKQGSRAK